MNDPIQTLRKEPMIADLSILRDACIAIGTPHTGTVTTEYLSSMVESQARLNNVGCHVMLIMQSSINVETCRNMIVAGFLGDTQATHLLFIDSDHGWKAEDIVRLLVMDKDLIGIVARKKIPDRIEWAANFDEGKMHIDDKGALRLNGQIGTGFLMISRAALVRMIAAYPQHKARHPVKGASQGEKDNYYSLFQFETDENGVQRSEDITFCRRWTDIGGEVWCDPNADIIHVGRYHYTGSVSSQFVGVQE